MGLYAKRTALAFNYAMNTPMAKKAKSAASTYVRKRMSGALRSAINSARGSTPSEVRAIVRRQIQTTADKRHFAIQLDAIAKRTFNSTNLCREIVQGDSVINRSGSSIHLNAIKVNYAITHTGVPLTVNPSTSNKSGLPGPITWYMFIMQTDRTDNPRDFWFKTFNEDGDVDFRYPAGGILPQNTPLDDVKRVNLEYNDDDIRILAFKKVIVSGCTGDTLDNTHKNGTMVYNFRSPSLLKFNNSAAATPPWLTTDLSKRYYFVYYCLQPDSIVDDSTSGATISAVCTTYFTDN